MLKRCLSVLLVALLVQLGCLVGFAKAAPESEAQRIEKVRAAIRSLGIGPKARIKVTLYDKSKLEGTIKEAGDDHFVITDVRTGQDSSVLYPQVKTAHGNSLNTGVKIAIAAGVVAGAVILTLFFLWHGRLSPGHG